MPRVNKINEDDYIYNKKQEKLLQDFIIRNANFIMTIDPNILLELERIIKEIIRLQNMYDKIEITNKKEDVE